MRPSYEALKNALDEVAQARDCITGARGYDREQAREGYEYAVAEVLVPAMTAATTDLVGDIDARKVEKLAAKILQMAWEASR